MASNQQITIEVVGKDSASGVIGKIGKSVDGLQDTASRGGLRDFLNGFADGARRAITESDNLNAASERAGQAHITHGQRLQNLAGVIRGPVILAFGAMAAGVAAAAAAITGSAMAAANWFDSLDAIGDVLGTTASESAALSVAIRGVGGNTEAITTQLSFMARGLTDAKGKLGPTGQALKALGIRTTDAGGKMKSTTRLLVEVATKLDAMPDGLAKTAAMMDVFGKSGKDMSDTIAALAGKGLDKASAKAKAFGLDLGEDGVANAIAFKRALANLGMAAQGLGISFGAALMPHITPLLEQFGAWAQSIAPDIAARLGGVADGIGEFITAIQGGKALGLTDAQSFQNAIRLMFGPDAARAIQPLLDLATKVQDTIAAFVGAKKLGMTDAQAFSNAIRVMFGPEAAKLVSDMAPKFDALGGSAERALVAIGKFAEFSAGGISKFLGEGAPDGKNILTTIIASMDDFLMQVPGFFEELQTVLTNPEKALTDALAWMNEKATAAWNQRAKDVVKGIEELNAAITFQLTRLTLEIQRKITEWGNIGRGMIDALIEGIKSQASAVLDALRTIIEDALRGAAGVLGIKLPGKVTGGAAGVGVQGGGFAAGGGFSPRGGREETSGRPIEVVINLDGSMIARKMEPHLRALTAHQQRAYAS